MDYWMNTLTITITHRTHQGLNGKTPLLNPDYEETTAENTELYKKSILNGLYHTYDKSA